MKNAVTLFIVITLSACHSGNSKPLNVDTLYSARLNGTWGCFITQPVEGVNGGEVSFKTIYSYIDNGKFHSSGSITLDIPKQKPILGYYLSGTGTWSIKDKKLHQTMQNIEIVNMNNPSMDKKSPSQSIFPNKIAESASILYLNNSKVSLKNDSDGLKFSCSKLHAG